MFSVAHWLIAGTVLLHDCRDAGFCKGRLAIKTRLQLKLPLWNWKKSLLLKQTEEDLDDA